MYSLILRDMFKSIHSFIPQAEAALSYDIAKVMEQSIWTLVDDKSGYGASEYLQHRNGRDCTDADFTPWRLDEQILMSVKGVKYKSLQCRKKYICIILYIFGAKYT